MGRKPSFTNNYTVKHEDPLGVRIAKRRAQLNAEQKIRCEREGKKYNALTQDRLAVAIGVSRDTIKKWESGKFSPDCDNLERLCNILDCDYDFLLGRIDVPYVQEFNIEEHLGLSKQGRINLHRLPEMGKDVQRAFDSFVSSEEFYPFIFAVSKYIRTSERALSALIMEPEDEKADGMLHIYSDPAGTNLNLSAVRTKDAVNCHELEAIKQLQKFLEKENALNKAKAVGED